MRRGRASRNTAWFAKSNLYRPMTDSSIARMRKFFCANINRVSFAGRTSLTGRTSCRVHDQTGAGGASVPSRYSSTHHASVYPLYSGAPEPRDIIPRASPSRPSSMHFSPPISPDTSHTSAISALKSLSVRPPSPSSPVGTYHSNIWPFGRSVATSPSTSYSRPVSGLFSSTYDGAYYSAGGYGTSSDRPLPSRRPGIYSRPKSIELVTPMVGR
jgi:hypothetical protein